MRKWRVGAGRDLGRMGDDQDLALLAQALQALADRVGDGAADAGVDLVEDHGGGGPAVGQAPPSAPA